MDHTIPTRRPDQKKKKKKTCHLVDFVCSIDHIVKVKENAMTNTWISPMR